MTDPRSCTCHPDDAPVPCQKGYALSVCKARAELVEKVADAIADGWDREGRTIDAASAAIDIVLEEAALLVRDCAILDAKGHPLNPDMRATCAAAIRALKGKG